MKVRGMVLDVFSGEAHPGEVDFGGRIKAIRRIADAPRRYILPGFVDGHVHVESSMLIPSEFARLAIRHGTVAVVADPHEIANVLGLRGVEFMMRNAKRVPLRFFFGASPCVPATPFETSGERLGPRELGKLLRRREVTHLAEVMNFPGVVAREPEIMGKIALAKKYGKRVDGHAPGLRGEALDAYISAGIETDHECSSLAEAEEKMRKGMKIQVREGSAARNLRALHPVLRGGRNMICVDDTDPAALLQGHLDALLARCVRLGVRRMDAIRACTRNPVEHYRLPVGLLRKGDPADFVVVRDLDRFEVLETWIGGRKVFALGRVLFPRRREKPVNRFVSRRIAPADIVAPRAALRNAIGAVDGELVTEKMPIEGMAPDLARDILKIVIINRYKKARPAVAFVKGFGLEKGAIGTSVMHDSHNVGVVGADDDSICRVANRIMEMKGGLAAFDGKRTLSLPLPFAGLMSGEPGEEVAAHERMLVRAAGRMGCAMKAPFMTLSFMGLLVIPHLKISDIGLFDGDKFAFVK